MAQPSAFQSVSLVDEYEVHCFCHHSLDDHKQEAEDRKLLDYMDHVQKQGWLTPYSGFVEMGAEQAEGFEVGMRGTGDDDLVTELLWHGKRVKPHWWGHRVFGVLGYCETCMDRAGGCKSGWCHSPNSDAFDHLLCVPPWLRRDLVPEGVSLENWQKAWIELAKDAPAYGIYKQRGEWDPRVDRV